MEVVKREEMYKEVQKCSIPLIPISKEESSSVNEDTKSVSEEESEEESTSKGGKRGKKAKKESPAEADVCTQQLRVSNLLPEC